MSTILEVLKKLHTEKLEESFDNPRDLASHFAKHCEASPDFVPSDDLFADKTPFTVNEIKDEQDYKAFATWFAHQRPLSTPSMKNNMKFTGDIFRTAERKQFVNSNVPYIEYTQYCKINQKYFNKDLYIICIYFIVDGENELKVRTCHKGTERVANKKSARARNINLKDYRRI